MLILLFGLWLLLSGKPGLETCVIGAAISGAVYLLACKTLGFRPGGEWKLVKKAGGGLAYLFYLLKEILLAGLMVMRLVYTKGRNMEPRLIWFRTELMSHSARAALADSITLTAGTITVSQEENLLCVHALDASLAEGLEHGPFEGKLKKLENKQ